MNEQLWGPIGRHLTRMRDIDARLWAAVDTIEILLHDQTVSTRMMADAYHTVAGDVQLYLTLACVRLACCPGTLSDSEQERLREFVELLAAPGTEGDDG